MARKQVGTAATRPEDAATRAFVVANAGSGGGVVQKLGADSAATSTTLTTGTPPMSTLWASLDAGFTYSFEFVFVYTTTATTVGSRWTINGPAFTFLAYRSEYSLTATSRTFNEGLGAYNLPAAANLTSAALTANIARIEGIITPSASGSLVPYFASETTAAITVKAGSYVSFRALPVPTTPQHSIWGAGTYPYTLVKETGTPITVSTMFYSYGTTPSVATWRVVGMKVWIPAGTSTSGPISCKAWFLGPTNPPTSNLSAAPTATGTITTPVVGWNTAMFGTPIETNAGDFINVGYRTPNGDYFGLTPAGAPTGYVTATDGSHIVMAENNDVNFKRFAYMYDGGPTLTTDNTGDASGTVYGIDIIYDEGAP